MSTNHLSAFTNLLLCVTVAFCVFWLNSPWPLVALLLLRRAANTATATTPPKKEDLQA